MVKMEAITGRRQKQSAVVLKIGGVPLGAGKHRHDPKRDQ